jgi:glucose/mannose-6-phosphate isomerase
MDWISEEFDDLDDLTTYAVDPAGVYGWIERTGSLLEDGVRNFMGKLDLAGFGSQFREVLICGMGGSAISGDIAKAVVFRELPVPISVVRGYTQPGGLGKGVLQIVVSYSGNTEESIWAYTQGHNRGAHLVVITSGGALKELAERNGHPLIVLPDDYPAPRLAIGHLLAAVLSVFDAAFDGMDFISESLADAVISLNRGVRRYQRDLPFDRNVAKKLAHDLHEAIPVVVGSALTWPVALRFRAQLNENAKWPCFVSMIPEMNHNEIVAYTWPGPVSGKIGLVMLVDKDDHPRVQFRQEFASDMVEDRISWVNHVKGEGKTLLGRLMSMIQTADFSSYYLACARGIDPLKIEAIDTLKERLGKLQ